MGVVVVDASVVIALRDAGDPHHHVARTAIDRARRDHRLVLPASALAESIVRPLTAGATEEEVTAPLLRLFTVEPLTVEIATTAAALRARKSLRLPDALVVATGIHLDAQRILTCDRRWKGVDHRVKVLQQTGA